MAAEPLAWTRTNRMALPPSTVWTEGDGCRIADTPSCRQTQFGHRLELFEPPRRRGFEGWFRAWRQAHRGKGLKVAFLTWEVPIDEAPPTPPLPPGVHCERGLGMVLEPALFASAPRRRLPPGLVLRRVGPADRGELLRMALENNGWTDDPTGRAYLDWLLDALMPRLESGAGAAWAVFDGARAVAYLALMHDAREARFQDVQTAEAHRRRGLCSALLARAIEERLAQAPGRPIHITPFEGAPAEGIYRSFGFRPRSVAFEFSTPAPRTEAELQAILREFEAGTLPLADWHHREHIDVAVQVVREAGLAVGPAMDRMRAALHRYLDAHGLETTPTSGYHETITRGWLELVARFLRGRGAESLEDAALGAQLAFADKRGLLAYWSRDCLNGEQSRARWVEPDLARLP